MLEELEIEMLEVEKNSKHNGYFYKISHVLMITVLGLCCGLQNIEDIYEWTKVTRVKEFFRKRFGMEKMPSRAHFYNLLSYVNHDVFNVAFAKWIQKIFFGDFKGLTITFDGKSIRSTTKLSKDSSTLHIVTGMIAETGMIIGSKVCKGKKESEITVFRNMLKEMNVKGAIIVADALHCLKKSAKEVIDAGGDYLFVLKDNNKTLKKCVELACHNKCNDMISKTEPNGGRIETRTAYVCYDIEHINSKDGWKNIICVGAIHREFEKDGKKSTYWHYYISSKKLTAEELLHHARMEWRIEAMHWLLDVHFLEDKTKSRDMEVQKNLNLMRKVALNLVKNYQASFNKYIPVSKILRKNLFDIDNLSVFIAHFSHLGKLD